MGRLPRILPNGVVAEKQSRKKSKYPVLSDLWSESLTMSKTDLSQFKMHPADKCRLLDMQGGKFLYWPSPLRKAERATARKERSESMDQTCDRLSGPKLKNTNPSQEKTWSPGEVGVEAVSPEKDAGMIRPAIPASIRQAPERLNL
jgi:hypothetical protein